MKTTFNFFDASKTLWSGAAIAAAVLMIGGGAPATSHALVLSAGDAICTSNDNGGNDTVFLTGCGLDVTLLDLLYKANRTEDGSEDEEGSFIDDYSTSFVPSTEAEITWDGPDSIVCPTCYLVAKDGDSEPNWFLFDLADWDGQETISIDPLFFKTNPRTGALIAQDFSHVSIWGNGGDTPANGRIPEPGMLSLLGVGLLGQAFWMRRRRQQK